MDSALKFNRRAVLRGAFALGVGALSSTALAACSAPEGNNMNTSPYQSPTPRPATSGASGHRVLLAYFSRAGENYRYGGRVDLTVGNTQVVAEMIAAQVEVGIYQITPADPYPYDYEETVARNVREEQSDARPKIAGALPSLTGYDTILLGSPIWNVQEPMIMRTSIDGLDWTGKTVHPFVTYAVSGMGNAQDDYTELLPHVTVRDGLAIQGEKVRDSLPRVKDWLRRINLAWSVFQKLAEWPGWSEMPACR